MKFSRKDYDEYDLMVEMAVKSGSSVVQNQYLLDHELDWAKKHGTSWYRSKEKSAGRHPVASYMLNKKWSMEEEFNNHILRFQQVTVSSVFI